MCVLDPEDAHYLRSSLRYREGAKAYKLIGKVADGAVMVQGLQMAR